MGTGVPRGSGSPGVPQCPPVPDDDTLVLPVDQHVPVHVVSQGVDVGGIFILGLTRGQGQQG